MIEVGIGLAELLLFRLQFYVGDCGNIIVYVVLFACIIISICVLCAHRVV